MVSPKSSIRPGTQCLEWNEQTPMPGTPRHSGAFPGGQSRRKLTALGSPLLILGLQHGVWQKLKAEKCGSELFPSWMEDPFPKPERLHYCARAFSLPDMLTKATLVKLSPRMLPHADSLSGPSPPRGTCSVGQGLYEVLDRHPLFLTEWSIKDF